MTNELNRVIAPCGSFLAHVLVARRTEVFERIHMLIEDLGVANIKEDPGTLGIHEPHAMVLVPEGVFLVRHLHNGVRWKALVGRGAAQRMPYPGKILGAVCVVQIIPLTLWSRCRCRASSRALRCRDACSCHLVLVEAPKVEEPQRIG
jgi:hypothetical protein